MDTNKLKELAERATGLCPLTDSLRPEVMDFIAAANPQAILGLIAEVERLRGGLPRLVSYAEDLSTCTLTMDDGVGYFFNRVTDQELSEVDRLTEEVERLRTRLEIDERTPYDGIACRDETIKGLDEKCDRLKAENEALRQFAAEAYQVLGALDAPENVLDNASDAASGVPPRHETLLPFFAEGYEALRKDAERYRWLKEQGHFRAMSIDMGGNHTWTGMGRSVGCGPTVDDAIDAALEGYGR